MKSREMLATFYLCLTLLWATGAWAQAQTAPTPQFDMLGFIQEATLDTAGLICPHDSVNDPTGRLWGGTISLNGIKMIVPCNTILQLPAATMTWGDLFNPANSAPVGSYIGAPALPVPATHLASSLSLRALLVAIR